MKEHIIINNDRTVVVPDSVRKIGIQYDHKVNTLTFDCPRYADDNQSIDLSRMAIYINFYRNDKTKGSVAATNIFVDPDNPEIIHFDVDITRSVTLVNGPIICLVCAKSTDAEGVEVNHWNSELFNKLSVGEGLEAEELTEEEIDYITSLLQEINTTRAEVAGMDTRVEDLEFNQEKQGVVREVDLEAMTWTEGSYITGSGTIGSSSGYGISEVVTLPKMSTLILGATGYQSDVAMIAKIDHTPLVTSVAGKTHYEYYTDEEIQVYISCKTTVAKSAKIVRNVQANVDDITEDIAVLKLGAASTEETIKASTADWNQNDESAVDYIKNKPFREETTEETILGEYTGELSGLKPSSDLVYGDKYVIYLDGVRYDTECTDDSEANNILYVNTEHGWINIRDYCLEIQTNITGIHTLKVVHSKIELYKIDSKFIDFPVISVNGKTGSVNITASDINAATTSQIADKMNKSNPVGIGSFSMGRKSGTTIGINSHAEGQNTTASGGYSHAEGYKTTASGGYSHAQGKYNIEDTEGKYAHIVGNGNSASARSNAHTLDWNGVPWFQGRPQFGGTAQDDGSQTVMANGDSEIILTSTGGKKFSITVDDSGALTDTEITT